MTYIIILNHFNPKPHSIMMNPFLNDKIKY